ncbi:MAG: hypothetical protein Kow0074_15060 [Candidatus Zixiibacteriota bacterium]
MMRFGKCLVIGVALLIPAMALAGVGPGTGDALVVGQARMAASGPGNSVTVTVPLDASNMKTVGALDMPLTFGEPGDGIELREVRWADRVEYFDLKIANIDNDQKRVLIGLVPLAYDPTKPRLEPSSGPLGELVFEITDPTMTEFTIGTYETERPRHRLMWVYSFTDDQGNQVVEPAFPKFEPTTIQVEAAGSSSAIPTQYSLNQNYPNPFNPSTEISFALPQAGRVDLSIYNVLGQHVRSLVNGHMEAGKHTVTWDGRDKNGNVAASGIYFYRIKADEFTDIRKMTLLK